MAIELPREQRDQAVTSIERYFAENFEQRIGNIAAAGLLSYFLEEIGPLVYNQAVAEAQERIGARVQELDIELHEEPLGHWRRREKAAAPAKGRK